MSRWKRINALTYSRSWEWKCESVFLQVIMSDDNYILNINGQIRQFPLGESTPENMMLIAERLLIGHCARLLMALSHE